MTGNKRILFGLCTFGTFMLVIIGLALMGQYERSRRSKRGAEYESKLDMLAEEISDLEAVRRIPVLYKERLQPLDSMARSEVRAITGRRSLYGADPVLIFLSMTFDWKGFGWSEIPCFLVQQGRNKAYADIHSADNLASYTNIDDSKGDRGRSGSHLRGDQCHRFGARAESRRSGTGPDSTAR